MENRRLAIGIYLFLILSTLFMSADPAMAGPGGGTYYANSPAGGASGTAIRKFVDSLPGVGAPNANNLGNFIPVATKLTDPSGNGDDYYEIGIVDYTSRFHSDLPKATRLRGYKDLAPIVAADNAHYLGPLIIAKRNKPVRIKFTNQLPTGTAGNLFIPVDTTVMGAGMGPLGGTEMYTQNRSAVHLHGGDTPWISDGTAHQWFTPAGEITSYPKGVSQRNLPDMPVNTVATGSETIFFPNQQSSRLMFYHDHAYGITRVNVYTGIAAGYLLWDQYEEDLISGTNVSGINPGLAKVLPDLGGAYHFGIPLVIQDKTFVPQNVAVQDNLWMADALGNPRSWGTYGDLWFPHVYETNQDPLSFTGANPFGRWDYGPWFWPPMNPATLKGPLPEPSIIPEAFMDTPIVNGTAYPYLTVQPKAYRFRILNACNDRMLNLQLYYVDNTILPGAPGYNTEVKMLPAVTTTIWPADYPTPDGRAGGFPDPAYRGPNMIQIGTEGGFLPAPAVIPNRPVGYDYNRRTITVLNVLEKALFLGPAERADVIIDFSSVPSGSTIILYNDAPAPVPAFDPRIDYYTGNVDQTASGGAPPTLPGYGPNTRTVMQFRVSGTPAAPFNTVALDNALPVAFAAAQPTPIVPQAAYGPAYRQTLPDVYSTIQATSLAYTPVNDTVPRNTLMLRKAIHELFELDYGRMNAVLGVELPLTNFFVQTTLPFGYIDPATEIANDNEVQIWKITHNGVDTHAIHFHLFNVQLINRVGWDGMITPPDPNELGWKETVRMNPLEDIVVALRPKQMTLPAAWGTLPENVRPLDPTQPVGGMMGFSNVDPYTGTPIVVTNDNTNFGYEYVWHCHLLGHEENDMMRAIIFKVPAAVPIAPTALAATASGTGNSTITLSWTDNSTNENGFRVERSVATGGVPGAYTPIVINSANTTGYVTTTYADKALAQNTTYYYRVYAFNSVGDSAATNVVGPIATGTFPSATSVSLVPSPLSPQALGTVVNWKGTALGGTGTYEYQFSYRPSGTTTWTVAQAYGTNNIWTWYTATFAAGNYDVQVSARSMGTTTAVSNTVTYLLTGGTGPATGVSLTPSPASPQVPGTTVTFTAAASGGSGSYQYQFWLFNGSTWSIQQAWSASNIWTWNTTLLTGGTYAIEVWARSVGSTVPVRDANMQVAYVLGAAPATAVTFTPAPSPASPQAPGTTVTFTATASGGSGSYQYQFWLFNGSTWSIQQAWSASNIWTWNTTLLTGGTYTIEVWARSAGSTVPVRDANAQTSYVLTTGTPATAVTFTPAPSPASPQPRGTTVTFTAAASGGSGPYQYQFWLFNGSTWSIQQAWSASNIWAWNTNTSLAAGTYTIEVWARSAGSTVPVRDANAQAVYVLQ